MTIDLEWKSINRLKGSDVIIRQLEPILASAQPDLHTAVKLFEQLLSLPELSASSKEYLPIIYSTYLCMILKATTPNRECAALMKRIADMLVEGLDSTCTDPRLSGICASLFEVSVRFGDRLEMINFSWKCLTRLMATFRQVDVRSQLDIGKVLSHLLQQVQKHVPSVDLMKQVQRATTEVNLLKFFTSHLMTVIRLYPNSLEHDKYRGLSLCSDLFRCIINLKVLEMDASRTSVPAQILEPIQSVSVLLEKIGTTLFRLDGSTDEVRTRYWTELVRLQLEGNAGLAQIRLIQQVLMTFHVLPESFREQFCRDERLAEYLNKLDTLNLGLLMIDSTRHDVVNQAIETVVLFVHALNPSQFGMFQTTVFKYILSCSDFLSGILLEAWTELISHWLSAHPRFTIEQHVLELVELLSNVAESDIAANRIASTIRAVSPSLPKVSEDTVIAILKTHPQKLHIARYFPYTILTKDPGAEDLVEDLLLKLKQLDRPDSYKFPLACLMNVLRECNKFRRNASELDKQIVQACIDVISRQKSVLESTCILSVIGLTISSADHQQLKVILDTTASMKPRHYHLGYFLISLSNLQPHVARSTELNFALKKVFDGMFTQAFKSVTSREDWVFRHFACYVAYTLSILSGSNGLDVGVIFNDWVSQIWIRYAERPEPDAHLLCDIASFTQTYSRRAQVQRLKLSLLKPPDFTRLMRDDDSMDVDMTQISIPAVLNQLEVLVMQLETAGPLSHQDRSIVKSKVERLMRIC